MKKAVRRSIGRSVKGSGSKNKKEINCIKNIDQFGMPVSLTFQRERLFHTGIGAGCSVICGIIILAYILYRVIEM